MPPRQDRAGHGHSRERFGPRTVAQPWGARAPALAAYRAALVGPLPAVGRVVLHRSLAFNGSGRREPRPPTGCKRPGQALVLRFNLVLTWALVLTSQTTRRS